MSDMPPIRVQLLKTAESLTAGDRDQEYGPPWRNLTDVAQLWEAYLSAKLGKDVTISAEDVAWMNVLQKIGRTFHGEPKLDTYTDAAAYAAIAGECAEEDKE